MMTDARIQRIRAREILDSRGNPTVEASVLLSDGEIGVASVPSGASTGTFEAVELRDHDDGRYGGRGVKQACANVVERIQPVLRGMRVADQAAADRRMIDLDATPNKAALGVNAILAVSLACARAAAASAGLPLYRSIRANFGLPLHGFVLPEPMLNVINGGLHADDGLDLQEYMIVPHGERFSERMSMAWRVTDALRSLLNDRRLGTLIGDEGGFAPRCTSNRQPLELLRDAVARTQLKPGAVAFALDPAASEFFRPADGHYHLALDGITATPHEMIRWYGELVREFPICSIEDGLAEGDWHGWEQMTKDLGSRVQLVGDDLFVTSEQRLRKGIAKGAANAILIKPNQIGTLTETIETIRLAQAHAYNVVVSHRSGETTDAFIADLAVAVNAPFIKAGALSRGERLAKYNRLLAIEEEVA